MDACHHHCMPGCQEPEPQTTPAATAGAGVGRWQPAGSLQPKTGPGAGEEVAAGTGTDRAELEGLRCLASVWGAGGCGSCVGQHVGMAVPIRDGYPHPGQLGGPCSLRLPRCSLGTRMPTVCPGGQGLRREVSQRQRLHRCPVGSGVPSRLRMPCTSPGRCGLGRCTGITRGSGVARDMPPLRPCLPRAPDLAHSPAWHLSTCVQIDGTEAKCAANLGARALVPRSQLPRAQGGGLGGEGPKVGAFPAAPRTKPYPLPHSRRPGRKWGCRMWVALVGQCRGDRVQC